MLCCILQMKLLQHESITSPAGQLTKLCFQSNKAKIDCIKSTVYGSLPDEMWRRAYEISYNHVCSPLVMQHAVVLTWSWNSFCAPLWKFAAPSSIYLQLLHWNTVMSCLAADWMGIFAGDRTAEEWQFAISSFGPRNCDSVCNTRRCADAEWRQCILWDLGDFTQVRPYAAS